MIKVLIPSGALGLGYDRAALERGIAADPDIIAIDGGSTDSGPSYLGRGVSKYSRASTKREWAELMDARARVNDGAGVPLVIGSAGTCGTDSTVDWMLDITREIAGETGQRLKVAILRSSQPAERVKTAMDTGSLVPLEVAPSLNDEILDSTTNIVALAGVEQMIAALETGADIIIAGRATDTATIAALPIKHGCNLGTAWHGAKIGECGAFCTTRSSSGTIMVEFEKQAFTVRPMAEDAQVTAHTVSAHMLYENADPYMLHEPGGHLDVHLAKYEQGEDNSVRVTGGRWVEADNYTVKLEGALIAGYQTMSLAMLRDPHYVENARKWADDIIDKASEKAFDRLGLSRSDFHLAIRLIGQDSVFGSLDVKAAPPLELGALAIITSQDPKIAAEVAKVVNPYLLHHPLTEDEPVPTFAFPFSPAEIEVGPQYEFCLNHVMILDDPMDAFTLETHEVGHG